MVNEHQYPLGEQQQFVFEDEDAVSEPLYLSERANLILAKETVINLAYYFHINKNSTLDSYKRVKDLFPKAVYTMEREGYTLAKAAILELENKLVKVYKDVNQLTARCIILVYKLLAYEKNHKRGRSKGFMTLSELNEKDIWKLKEFVKRAFNFFEAHPGGQLKVSLTHKEYPTDQSLFIDYVHENTAWSIDLFEDDEYNFSYDDIFNKRIKYNTISHPRQYLYTTAIFDLCTYNEYIKENTSASQIVKQTDDNDLLFVISVASGVVFLIVFLMMVANKGR